MSWRVDEMTEAATRPESAQTDTNERVTSFAALLARDEFLNELDWLSCSEWQWGTRQEVRFQALKWHKYRCTFEIAVKTESGWHSVIGKVYKTDRSDTFRAMETLRRAGFGSEAEFSIPRPLVYLSSLGVRLDEHVQGPSAKEIFLTGSPQEHVAAAERCGRWLARFHAAAPRLGKVTDLNLDFPRYQHWADQVAGFGEALAPQAGVLVRKVQGGGPRPPARSHRARPGPQHSAP